MARAQTTDFYHAMKYHARVVSTGVTGAANLGNQGGFNTMTMPEATVESVEYKEGIYLYRRKFPGDVTFSDITFTRGVAKKNTDLYTWVRNGYLGKEYRVDLQIRHFHREETADLNDYTNIQPKRVINIFDAFAIRVKPGSDFDAQSSDVSIEEVDVVLERFELVDTNS